MCHFATAKFKRLNIVNKQGMDDQCAGGSGGSDSGEDAMDCWPPTQLLVPAA